MTRINCLICLCTGFLLMTFFATCNKAPTTPQIPPELVIFNDPLGGVDDTITFFAVSSDSARIKNYVWYVDDSSTVDTTSSNFFTAVWSDTGLKTLVVKAIDDDNLVSDPETSTIKIEFNAPYIEIMDSITISINDTLYLGASAHDDGSIVKYVWSLDGTDVTDTTTRYYLRSVWDSSGVFSVIVKAIDNHEQVSEADTCTVIVLLNPPVVHMTKDSSVNIKDTIAIQAKAKDNEGVLAFIWSKNGTRYEDTTETGIFQTSWSDTGIQTVWVKAIDNDGVLSEPDSCTITVTLDPPQVSFPHDTLISTKQTTTFIASAKDNGRIIKYIWNVADKGYRDSTTIPTFRYTWPDSGLKTVSVIAMDDDSIFSAPETCFVHVKSLVNGDVVRSVPVKLLTPNPDFSIDSCFFVRSSSSSDFIYATFPVLYTGDSIRQFVYLDSICYHNISGGIIATDRTYLHKRNMQLNTVFTNTCIGSGDTGWALTVHDSLYSQLASITIKSITYSAYTGVKTPDAVITLKSFTLDGYTVKMTVTNEGTKSAKLSGTSFFVLRDEQGRPVYHWMAYPDSIGSILAVGGEAIIKGSIASTLPDWKSIELIPSFEDVKDAALSKKNVSANPVSLDQNVLNEHAILTEMQKKVSVRPFRR